MISTEIPKVVHNHGHGFSKRFTLQGCTILTTDTVRLLACTLVLFLGGWQSGRGYNLWLA